MFSLKRSNDPNPTNTNLNTALPNTYGRIRTMKEDLINLQAGKKEPDTEIIAGASQANTPPAPVPQETPTSAPTPPPAPAPLQPMPAPPQPLPASPPPPQSQLPAETPMPPVSKENSMGEKDALPSPFGTNEYFSDKSPFEKLNETPVEKTEKSPRRKKSNASIAIISVILFLAILGGGFYYYWFFMRTPAVTTSPTPAATTTQTPAEKIPETTGSTNKDVQALLIDPALGSAEFQKSFQKMSADFLSSTAENKLIETRPVGKDNQPLPVKDFIAVSLLGLPETITQRFSTSDYSLFIKRENGEARSGIVFSLTDSTSVPEEMLAQEKNLPSEMKFLYLSQTLPGTEPTFHSSKYKNADIRYYNFPSLLNTSFDYSVIKGTAGGYLVIATSKETMRSILDYMSQK